MSVKNVTEKITKRSTTVENPDAKSLISDFQRGFLNCVRTGYPQQIDVTVTLGGKDKRVLAVFLPIED